VRLAFGFGRKNPSDLSALGSSNNSAQRSFNQLNINRKELEGRKENRSKNISVLNGF